MYPIAGHSFQPRKLKLGVNDHLMGADVLGYPDIRISGFEIFGFFRILGPCGPISKLLYSNLVRMIISWLRMLWAIRISGYPLLKISDFFGYLDPIAIIFKVQCLNFV